MGDIGCAVFIVEATNPKNVDLNKNSVMLEKMILFVG